MKTWWKYSWMLGLVAFVAATMVACSKKSDGGGAITCAPGQVMGPAGGCVVGIQHIPGSTNRIGFYAQTTNNPLYANAGSSMNINNQGFTGILKDAMGVCDREQTSCGTAACSSWMQGFHDIVLMFPNGSTSNNAYVMIRSYPYVNPYYSYYCSIPKPEVFFGALMGFNLGNPSIYSPTITLNSTVWPINDNKGFEIRADGPTWSYASNKLFQLQVTNGKMEDGSFNYTLYYAGQIAATGNMVRCGTSNCGIQGL